MSRQNVARLAAGLLVALLVACGAAQASVGGSGPASPPLPVEGAIAAARANAVERWSNAELLNRTEAWDAAVAENFWHGIELLAENYRPPPPSATTTKAPAPPSGGGGSSVGGSCGSGWAMGDGTMQHESNGNPNALGPSTSSGRAWGCAQIMQGTWSGAGCAGTWGSASVDQQKACAAKVMAKGGRSQWTAAP